MDLERIEHLQQLAGLELTAREARQILRDLTLMDRRTGFLEALEPAAPHPEEAEAAPEQPESAPAPELDEGLIRANAPDFEAGLFRVPAVDTGADPDGTP
jgi:Asp-tRNA(Asn)/Glu-tRNA(Gln) amidotransferase C subunit